MRFYVLSCNGCANAIRCWIGGSERVADIACSGFNLTFLDQLPQTPPAIL
jgi:hypothetical protein